MLKIQQNKKGSATLIPSSLPGMLTCVHLFLALGWKEKVWFLSLRTAFEVRWKKGIKRNHSSLRFIVVQWAFLLRTYSEPSTITDTMIWSNEFQRSSVTGLQYLLRWLPLPLSNICRMLLLHSVLHLCTTPPSLKFPKNPSPFLPNSVFRHSAATSNCLGCALHSSKCCHSPYSLN